MATDTYNTRDNKRSGWIVAIVVVLAVLAIAAYALNRTNTNDVANGNGYNSMSPAAGNSNNTDAANNTSVTNTSATGSSATGSDTAR